MNGCGRTSGKGMDLKALIEQKRTQILEIAYRHGAKNVRVFGSVARGEFDVSSDIDFLVQLEDNRTLLDHAALLLDLQTLLGCHVDVVTENRLRPAIRDRILKEAVSL